MPPLKVSADEIVSIIGPNGTGKSTLLKSIFGLVKKFSGSIFFDSFDITSLKPHQIVRKGMCYVPQDDNVFPSLTVKENLDMGAFARHDDYDKSIEEVYKPNMVDEMMKKIKLINREERAAILIVEQNAKRVLSISNRGYVLSMGKNEFEDTGEALLNNPDIGKLYLGE